MHLFMGVTDKRWFDYMHGLQPDEVNFWKPGGTAGFSAVEPGAPFLFKLHAPFNKIAGGGFFVKFEKMHLSLAWDTFGEKNGAADFPTFRDTILRYRGSREEKDPVIGCIILASPFFLPPEEWLDVPADWAPNIVQGRKYDTATEIGAWLWAWAQRHLRPEEGEREIVAIQEEGGRYGMPALIRPRLGQGSFRLLVTDAYSRRCAVSGEKTLPVLEAAHIRSFKERGPHKMANGLLLRADLHKLFDSGLITVTKDLRVEVSPKIKEEWQNGKEDYRFHGSALQHLPHAPEERPAVEFIEWHNEEVFRG